MSRAVGRTKEAKERRKAVKEKRRQQKILRDREKRKAKTVERKAREKASARERHHKVIENYASGMSMADSWFTEYGYEDCSMQQASDNCFRLLRSKDGMLLYDRIIKKRESYVSRENAMDLDDIASKMKKSIIASENLVQQANNEGDLKAVKEGIALMLKSLESYSKLMGKGSFKKDVKITSEDKRLLDSGGAKIEFTEADKKLNELME